MCLPTVFTFVCCRCVHVYLYHGSHKHQRHYKALYVYHLLDTYSTGWVFSCVSSFSHWYTCIHRLSQEKHDCSSAGQLYNMASLSLCHVHHCFIMFIVTSLSFQPYVIHHRINMMAAQSAAQWEKKNLLSMIQYKSPFLCLPRAYTEYMRD